jgi:uncharacterized protein (DUF58 family)
MRWLQKLRNWKSFLRVAKPDGTTATLTRRHIYIIPTRYGWLYALMLLAMLTGAINYSLSLVFIVTFLLIGVGMMAMLHSWRNLAHLKLYARQAAPVFAGQPAIFECVIHDAHQRARYGIRAELQQNLPSFCDIAAHSDTLVRLQHPTQQRGWLQAPNITLASEFPLSLFHVWAYANLEMRCLIYPYPSLTAIPIPTSADTGSTGALTQQAGDDDFIGHRQYQFGDSPKRVDWKASSRDQGMYTKLFQGEAQQSLWLDWQFTSGAAEKRISMLARWVIDAHEAQHTYGLRLPHLEIPMDKGLAHYHACLSALALMEIT